MTSEDTYSLVFDNVRQMYKLKGLLEWSFCTGLLEHQ